MSSSLADTITSKAKDLGLTFIQRAWPKKLSNRDIIDLEASIIINKRIYTGYGTSFNEDTAIIKATVEAVERAIAYEDAHLYTSNGVAGHSSLDHAKIAASLELMERDAFFSHFITKSPLENFTITTFTPEISCFMDDFKLLGYKLSFSRLKSIDDSICIHLSAQKSDSMLIGLGSGHDFKAAILSALDQLLRLAVIVDDIKIPSCSISEFNSFSKYNEHSHLGLCFNKEYIEKYSFWFDAETKYENHSCEPMISHRQLYPCSDQLKKICDELQLFFIKASCTMAQELYFGRATEEKINTNKFRNTTPVDICGLIPHPLC